MKLYKIVNSSYYEALSLNFLLAEMKLKCAEEDNVQQVQICTAYNDANYVLNDANKFISRVLSDFDKFKIETL